MIKKQNIQKQVTEATAIGSITSADGRKKVKFRFIDNTENLQDFIIRFNENSRYALMTSPTSSTLTICRRQ
jgi:hypothetical protein